MAVNDVHPPEEPLTESAPLAWQLAARLCRRDPASGESCAWYHSIWQYLRLLDVAMTAAYHTDFYRAAFRTAARRGAVARVLISAAADYCTLAHAAAYLREQGVEAEFTLVDLCETPLTVNRWYAERHSLKLTAWRGDILEFQDDRPYDAICTHSFFGRFLPERRPALIDRWAALLRPGGVAITVNRIQPHASAGLPTRFTEQQAIAFRDSVMRAAHARGGMPGIGTLEFSSALDLYTRQPAGYPVCSREEFIALLDRPEFEPVELTWAPATQPARSGAAGPRTPGADEYGRVIAARR